MSRPVRAALALALTFSLLSAPALAQRRGHGGMPGGGLTPAGNPSALIAAEIAFARLAREKGQWTAFRETAADDAEMFTPRRVVAKDWLKGRKDPAQAVQWETHRAYASCDGSFGTAADRTNRPRACERKNVGTLAGRLPAGGRPPRIAQITLGETGSCEKR